MKEDGFILAPHLLAGGTARDSVEWANRFSRCGLRVPLIVYRREGDFARRLDVGVPLEFLGASGALYAMPKLWRRLRTSPYAFVLTNCSTSAVAIIWLKRLRLFHGRIIFVESVSPSQALRTTCKAIYAHALIRRHADAIVHLSAYARRYSAHLGLEPKRSFHIPNIVTFSQGVRPELRPDSRFRLIAIGRLDVVKGYERLIDAMPSILRIHPKISLRIYGDGDQREPLRAQIARLRLEDYVELMGHTDNVNDAMHEADVFVLTSYFEGMPNALIEALGARMPIIATSCGGSVKALLSSISAGLALINEGPAFTEEIAKALTRIKEGKVDWEKIHREFMSQHDSIRNFDRLRTLCNPTHGELPPC